MTMRFVIQCWLSDNEYHGLVNPEAECGCLIGDLAPCDNLNLDECYPGYKCKATPEEQSEYGYGWIMRRVPDDD